MRSLRVPSRLRCWCAIVALGTLALSLPPFLLAAGDEPLPRDPQNTYGQLENGLRYILRRNTNPPGRVALYLHVAAGALHETDRQNGLAHFLEHMAFNGSAHYPPGTLIPFLNKLGMSFGAHSNAHTTHHETVYKLFMPESSDASLDTALTILADYSFGLELSEVEIDKERKVILEESRAHQRAERRIRDQLEPLFYPGSQYAEHDVIGIEEQIATFPRSEFVDYWNTWYRPERMTLIVVGDVDLGKAAEKIRAGFDSCKARAKERPFEGTGVTAIGEPRAFIVTDREIPAAQIQLTALLPGRAPMRTCEDYYKNEVENMGTWLLTRRLQDRRQRGEADYLGAFCQVGSVYHDLIEPSVMARGEPDKWRTMLTQLISEIDRAVEHGFTERELDLAKKEWISNAERALETEPTWEARAVIDTIASFVGLDHPLLSAGQSLDLVRKVVARVTLADMQQIFSRNFQGPAYTYSVILPESMAKRPSEADVLAAANETWIGKTEAASAKQSDVALLEKLPEPGAVASRSTDAETGVTTVTFENGAILHHRRMDYQKNEVLVQVTLPGGALEENAENRGVSEVASLVNATSRLSSTQIRDLMTGKKIGIGGRVGLDEVSVALSGSPADLDHGLQVAYAMLTDGKVEATQFERWREQKLLAIEREKSDPGEQLQHAVSRVFRGGDVRFAPLGAEQVQKLTLDAGQAWARRYTGLSPVEVAVVGDISLEDALTSCARYLGSLPKAKRDFRALDPLRKVQRPSGPYVGKVEVDTITDKAFVLAGYAGCNERDVVDRRVLSLVATILTERMRSPIREDQQLVYSIRCTNQYSTEVPGLGQLMAIAPTGPDNAERLADEIIKIMQEFAANGPTDAEIEIARKQVLTTLEESLKEPAYWLTLLHDMTYRGRTLEEIKQLPGVFATFTKEQVHEVAKKYIRDDRMLRFIAVPKAAAEKPRE